MFDARRTALFATLPNSSGVLMQSAALKARNHDTEFPYRQESYFYYLTGIKQADVLIFLEKRAGKTIFHVFCDDRNPDKERWIGRQMGRQEAKEMFGADEVHLRSAFDEKMIALLQGLDSVYFFLDDMFLQRKMANFSKQLKAHVRNGVGTPSAFKALEPLIAPLRLIKSPEEIKLMQKAITISEQAHIQAMRVCKPGMYEYVLEAELLHTFYKLGSRYPAYTSIVAGGANACILHYVDNDAQLKAGDLVLIDAGAEYEYYAADITRTFPVSGKFSSAQQAVYELVLSSQLKGIEVVKKGALFEHIQKAILEELATGLKALKILDMDEKEIIETKAYQKYYMHKSGHWLGLDVHDVGSYHQEGKSVPLDVHQTLTIEPGLYFDPSFSEIPEKFRGIGIRIEDDILVQEKGCDVLSKGAPKLVHEIEKLMQHGSNV